MGDGFVISSYVVTTVAVAAYVASLVLRGRRARRRAEAISAKRPR